LIKTKQNKSNVLIDTGIENIKIQIENLILSYNFDYEKLKQKFINFKKNNYETS
jgi:hypothetical protein